MAITTGGGVAFSESANSRANREQLLGQMNQAQAQMQQESQFKRKQLLDTANQKFGQEIQMGLADPGGLEKYIAEHPQNFALIEQMMSGAIGRKVTMAEALQQGLGASSAGFAENPSLQRMTYEYLQRLPNSSGGGGGETVVPPPAPGPVPNPVPSPPGPVSNVPRTNKANYGPGMGVQEGPIVPLPQGPTSFQGNGEPIVRAPIPTDRTEAYKAAASGVPPVLAAKAAPAQTTKEQDDAELQRQQGRSDNQPANSFAPPEALKYTGMPDEITPAKAWAKQVMPKKSGESTQQYDMRVQKWANNFYELNNINPVNALDPKRSYILPEGSVSPAGTEAGPGRQLSGNRTSMGDEVGPAVAEFAQGFSSDVQTQGEQVAQAIQASRRAPTAPAAGSPQQLQQTPGFAAWANRPATVQESGIAPSGPTPKAQEALAQIEQRASAPAASDTPFYDAKQAEISTAKFKDSFTKATDLAKSLMSGDASKSLKQSDKAALAAAQTRAMALSEKIKNMDGGEYQTVRAEYVKWIDKATPMELEAAGLPEVANKAESVWLARFQASAAIEAAQARGGSETAAAIIDMRGKAMDQVRGILEIANTAAKNDPNYKGDIAKFFEKNPMYRDMMVPFASMAFGQPVSIDMIMKDPNWFQKLLDRPSTAVGGIGISTNNWEGARERPKQKASEDPALTNKYYEQPRK